MRKTVKIVKQVKLKPNQKIALIAAANNGGVLKDGDADYGARETLRYLGLIEEFPARDPAKLRKELEEAWKRLQGACRVRNQREADTAMAVIRHCDWEAKKTGYRLTAAASEYLDKGRIVIEVGKDDPLRKSG
jgi:hypothetical protein